MLSAASGLRRLFDPVTTSFPSISLKAQQPNDSIVEDSVTRDLLFPAVNGSYEGQAAFSVPRHGDATLAAGSAKNTDDTGGLEGHTSRDIRIVVAQRINEVPRVLLDTKPPIPYTPARTNTNPGEFDVQRRENRRSGGLGSSTRAPKPRTAPHSRQVSLPHTSNGSISPGPAPSSGGAERGGIFGTSRLRGITSRYASSESENVPLRLAREEREQQDDILNCMFGAPGQLISSSTKVHVKPQAYESPAPSRPLSPIAGENVTPKATETRRSFLFRSHTAEDLVNMSSSSAPTSNELHRPSSGRSSVIVTRVFTVSIKEDEFSPNLTSNETTSTESANIPVHDQRPSSQSFGSTSSSKQMKSPSFAVSLVIYLPNCHRRSNTPTSTTRPPTMDRLGSLPPSTLGRDIAAYQMNDMQIETVMERLALIVRALENLESTAKSSIKRIVQTQFDGSTASIRRALQFDLSTLQDDHKMREQAGFACTRVSHSLQIRLVMVGQDRWAMWKGVARAVGLLNSASDTNNFLLKLLSAFLAHNHEWLDALTPKRSQRARLKQQQEHANDMEPIASRTVIVCPDKMLARRVIFLLSMFFPGTRLASLQPESRTSSFPLSAPYSSSHGSHRQSSPHSPVKAAGIRTPTFASSDTGDFAERPFGKSSPSRISHLRRPSDALSVRSIAMPIKHSGTRSSSITTTATAATIIPDAYYAVPQFATLSPGGASSNSDDRPGSGGSLAALSLQRTLSRTDSNDQSFSSVESRSKDRYSSTRSGFWSIRRSSSASISEAISSPPVEGTSSTRGGPLISKKEARPQQSLQTMVEDASAVSFANGSPNSRPSAAISRPNGSPPQSIASPPTPPDPFPLTLSFDTQDNVVDVQCPSTPSTTTSPVHSKPPLHASFTTTTTTSSSLDSNASPVPLPTHHQLGFPPFPQHHNARTPPAPTAGYLRTFHPDFSLQGVKPYEDLGSDVQAAMHAEAACSTSFSDQTLRTLIVDPLAQTIQLLTLPGSPSGSSIQETDLTPQPPDPLLSSALSNLFTTSQTLQQRTARTPSPAKLDTLPRNSNAHDETRRTIWTALEKIAKIVTADEGADIGRVAEGSDEREREQGVLREGVRRWLKAGEEGHV